MRIAYPTIFTELETNILIEVPDLGVLIQANEEGKKKAGLAEAVSMARDAIGVKCISLEEQGVNLTTPSSIQDIGY